MVMHVLKLNSIFVKANVNYDLKVLKVSNNLQLLRAIATEFWYDVKKKKKKSKKKSDSNHRCSMVVHCGDNIYTKTSCNCTRT